MNAETLKALKGSIVKWQGIVEGTVADDGPENCPLCQLFNKMGDDFEYCSGCPVSKDAGESGCNNTPYERWSDLDEGDGKATTEEQKEAAIAELRYLESLLPQSDAAEDTEGKK